MTHPIQPLFDRGTVEVDPSESVSTGGILLAPVSQEEARTATVLAVGPGARNPQGGNYPMQVKVGDRIMFSKYANEAFKYKGKEYRQINEQDILGVIE